MSIQPITEVEVEQAMQQALASYFADCRNRVPCFVRNHFQYPGAAKTNSKALGWDLLRSPLNLFWAPIYITLLITAFVLQRLSFTGLSNWIKKIPSGLSTCLQQYISGRIKAELLEVQNIARYTQAFVAEISNKQAVADPRLHRELTAIIKEALNEYAITRTASADITNTITSSVVGALTWNKFTPGAFAIGFLIAAKASHAMAVNDFIFGEALGAYYFSIFPSTPSPMLQILGVTSVLTLMAVFAAFSGYISDPVQSALGIHRRRLEKMINTLERDFFQSGDSSYKPKDQYIARMMDAVDAVRSQVI